MSDYRRYAIPIGIAAAVLLAYLYNPWVNPERDAADGRHLGVLDPVDRRSS